MIDSASMQKGQTRGLRTAGDRLLIAVVWSLLGPSEVNTDEPEAHVYQQLAPPGVIRESRSKNSKALP